LSVNREVGFQLEGVDTAWDTTDGKGAEEVDSVKVQFKEAYGEHADGDQRSAADVKGVSSYPVPSQLPRGAIRLPTRDA
jgi:hypothetical protein